MTKCEVCGHQIEIGSWPWCGGDPSKHVHVNSFGEEPLEPYIDHNITDAPEGIEIRTRGERRKLMDEAHLDYRPKTKLPGSRLYFDMKGR